MPVKFKQGHVTKGNGLQNVGTLSEALAEEARCGCGIECPCYGMLVLPNWDSATGCREDGWAVYIVDGALVVSTKEEAEDAIKALKALKDVGCTLEPKK